MKPILLHYYITNRCNAACSFCDIWKEQIKTDANLDTVVKNLRDARIAGCSFVDFTGGEPLLHPHLPQFLQEAKKLGFITSVTTNCILFEKRAQELSGLIDLLHFSLDADNAILHNKIRGSVSYDKVVQSIPIALQHNLVPDLLFTYTNDNINSFEGVYELARNYKIMVIVDPVFSLDGKDRASSVTHHIAEAYAKRPGVYLNKAHIALRKAGGNQTRTTICKAAQSTIVILPDNSMALPCYHHAQEFIPLQTSLLKNLGNERRMQAISEQGTYLFCKGCHINCYFDPSFTYAYNPMFLKSILSKMSYSFQKYIVYKRKIPLPQRIFFFNIFNKF